MDCRHLVFCCFTLRVSRPNNVNAFRVIEVDQLTKNDAALVVKHDSVNVDEASDFCGPRLDYWEVFPNNYVVCHVFLEVAAMQRISASSIESAEVTFRKESVF